MSIPRNNILSTNSPTHFLIFSGTFILIIFFFIFYKISSAVIYDPGDNYYHTHVMYYDGNFSNRLIREDVQTGLFLLNTSTESVEANIYEYDRFGLEKKETKTIDAGQNQFIKTEGPGVVYLNNLENTKRSIIKFSKWLRFQIQIPRNFFD